MQFATDVQGRLLIPRPPDQLVKDQGAPIPPSEWFHDLVFHQLSCLAYAYEAADCNFNDLDLQGVRMHSFILAALMDAGPDGVTFSGTPDLRVV